MPRNIQDEFPLILSEPKEPDKDRSRNKRINRVYSGTTLEWLLFLYPAFLEDRLTSLTRLYLNDGTGKIYLNDETGKYDQLTSLTRLMLFNNGQIESSQLTSLTQFTLPNNGQNESELLPGLQNALENLCSLPIDKTSLALQSAHHMAFLAMMVNCLDTIAELTITLPEHDLFIPGSYHRSTRTRSLNDFDAMIRLLDSAYQKLNLSLLENLQLEETDDLEGIDAFVVSNGVTMNLVIKRSLVPEDKSRGIEHLLRLCKYGQEIGVYMWKVDDELIETE